MPPRGVQAVNDQGGVGLGALIDPSRGVRCAQAKLRRWASMQALALSALTLLAALPGRALADAAPLRTMGPSLQPVGETRVRMENERIEIRLRRGSSGNPWQLEADVQVLFRFLPGADEQMEAGFPLQPRPRTPGQDGAVIRDFSVTSGGVTLPHQVKRVDWEGVSTDWAVWHLSFRKGQAQEVVVRYRMPVEPQAKGPWGDLRLDYVLRTGAFWTGTIGRAEAILRSERPILPEDLMAGTTPGWQLQDGAVYWEWRDLEPDFDLQVATRNPFWLDLASELEPLLAKPNRTVDETLRLALWFNLIYEAYRGSGYHYLLRDGRKAGQWADTHVDEFISQLSAAVQENPGHEDLKLYHRWLVTNSWVEHGPDGPVLRSAERLRRYLDLVKDDPPDAGDRAVRNAYDFARTIYMVTPETDLRQRALERLLGLMPAAFQDEAAVTAWMPRRDYQPAGVELEIEADIRKVARERTTPAPATAAQAGQPPVSQADPDPATNPTPDPGWSLAPYAGLAMLVLGGAALAILRLKQKRRPRV